MYSTANVDFCTERVNVLYICTVLQVFVILHKLTVDVLLIYCFESAASVEVGSAHSAQAKEVTVSVDIYMYNITSVDVLKVLQALI